MLQMFFFTPTENDDVVQVTHSKTTASHEDFIYQQKTHLLYSVAMQLLNQQVLFLWRLAEIASTHGPCVCSTLLTFLHLAYWSVIFFCGDS